MTPRALLDDADLYWRARQQPPHSLVRRCRESSEDPAEAPLLVDLVFELLEVAARVEPQHHQAFDDFLGGALADAMRRLDWASSARRRTEQQLPGLEETTRLRLIRASIPVLGSLMCGGPAVWLQEVASHHGAVAARSAALFAIATNPGADQRVHELLATHAAQDRRGEVRLHALESILLADGDSASMLSTFIASAGREATPGGYADRLFAIETLGGRWPEVSSVHALLEDLSNHREASIRQAARQALSTASPESSTSQLRPTIGQPTLGPFPHDYPAECQAAFQAVADADPALHAQAIAVLESADAFSRRRLLQAWWASNSKAPAFKDSIRGLVQILATKDPDRILRQSAIDCLAQSRFEQRVETLIDRALNDPAEETRYWALRRLPQTFSEAESSMILDTLRYCLKAGDTYSIRQQAARSLAEVPLGKMERDALMEQASHDERGDVRFSAVETLGRTFAGDETVRDFLIERSAADIEWFEDECELLDFGEEARGAALIGLARSWPEDPKVHDWVRWRAENEPSEHVRRDALEALVLGWPGDPATVDWLIHLAGQGDIEDRGKAIELLARSWPDIPAVRDCLQRVVDQETVPGYVATALEALKTRSDFSDRARSRDLYTSL